MILARNPAKAIPLMGLSGPATTAASLETCEAAITGAALIINASTLGMIGADPMPAELLNALAFAAPDATVFDMITAPTRTAFLDAGGSARPAYSRRPGDAGRPGAAGVRTVLRLHPAQGTRCRSQAFAYPNLTRTRATGTISAMRNLIAATYYYGPASAGSA